MTWQSWEHTWQIHARSSSYRSRVKRAFEIIEEAERRVGKLFCGLSGGKDSLAMLAMLRAAQAQHVVAVHCSTPLNTPGMAEAAEAAADALGFDYEEIEPDLGGATDIWRFLRELPRDKSILGTELGNMLRRATASGNMLVAYLYGSEFRGAYSGMRADESQGRAMNRRVRGPLYQNTRDGTWMCCPIVDWTGRDVWACITANGLQAPPHYRLLYERFGVSPESPMSRVDCVVTDDAIAARGAIAHLPVLYPELWARLVEIRPELQRAR